MPAQEHPAPPLGEFIYRHVPRPKDGILWMYRSTVDGFWHIDNDADIALQEATGYPVGELVEYEELGDYESGETGELRAVFVGEHYEEKKPACPTCGVRDFIGEGSLIPVWENPVDYQRGENPDYIGCTECHEMEPFTPGDDRRSGGGGA